MDKSIVDFFSDRKEGWLKKNIKASMSEVEKAELNAECEEVFAAKNWLPSAAKRAGQISISTHPCTFSHPSSRKNKNGYASSIIAKVEGKEDGFLRSGNVSVVTDALGNAAALDVYKFLTVKLTDGQTLLEHLQQDTPEVKVALEIKNPTKEQEYLALKNGFMAMLESDAEAITSSKIKQVYFPIDNDMSNTEYHQLSILTPSGIVFDLRKRLDGMRFGDEIKASREFKRNNKKGASFKEIYGLTTIGYGGTKPQNISVLNNSNGGKAHLFMSMPPSFKNRDVQFPTTDIFKQNIRYTSAACRSKFYLLDRLYKQDRNNAEVRAKRDELYQDLVDYVLETVWQVRSVKDQYLASHSTLSMNQRIWLQVAEAPENNDWLEDIIERIALFIFHGYEKVLSKKAVKLGAEELKQVLKVVEKNKEILR
jgi:CRISPR-associated protein Csy1